MRGRDLGYEATFEATSILHKHFSISKDTYFIVIRFILSLLSLTSLYLYLRP